jgi:hypothetical protein
VTEAALNELEEVLSAGCITLRGVRVVYDSLPSRAICAATVVDDVLWLVCDLDKPSANRHALAMLREVRDSICQESPVASALRALQAIRRRAPLALVG